MADREQLRKYLLDTPVSGDSWMEREGYVTDALERFRVTMALLPPLRRGAPVLELGAGPYFLTRLLLNRGLDVTCANWFGEDSGQKDSEVIERSADGQERVIEYDLFNVETDRFPYDDNSFDLVLCCEILEHLPSDPIHMLAEIHRVLRNDSGVLLLTTPNAVRMLNLVYMLNGDNIYEQYSGHGPYGRHNREFTVAELRRLLNESGYQVNDVFALDVHPTQPGSVPHLEAARLADRGDNLFALATPVGRRRWAYNQWLYSSQDAIAPQIVQPDVVVGENCYLQTKGLYPAEHLRGDWARWTGYQPEASVTLAPVFSGAAELSIQGVSAPAAVSKPITLFARIANEQFSWELASTGEPFRVVAEVTVSQGPQQVRLWTDRTFVPAEVGVGADRRPLGVLLQAVRLQRTEPGLA